MSGCMTCTHRHVPPSPPPRPVKPIPEKRTVALHMPTW